MLKLDNVFGRENHRYDKIRNHFGWHLFAGIYGLILLGMNFIRIFNNNFWGDEAFTIRLVQMNLSGLLCETAQDVHPPLYYILVKLICSVFGFRDFVFHFASLLPYLILLVLTLTLIWRTCGKTCSLLFMTLISILPGAVRYNVEVRMYSWGAFFLFLSFLFLGRILRTNEVRDYVGFSCVSLAAAYTHYYCLVSVAFFYLVLLFWMLIRRGSYVRRVIGTCFFAVIGYLPWLFVLLSTFKRTSEDFWMAWIPTLKECFGAVFEGKCQYFLFAVLLLSALAVCASAFLKEGKRKGVLLSAEMVWLYSGFFSLFGTMLAGILVSRIVRPLFIVRYLYPVSVVAWFLLGYCLSRLKGRAVYTAGVLLLLWLTCIPQYRETYLSEKRENEILEATLAATEERIRKTDVILTDDQVVEWTVSDYYYPGVAHRLIDPEEISGQEIGEGCWLILGSPITDSAAENLEKQGFGCETVVSDGILGTNPAYIYRLDRHLD